MVLLSSHFLEILLKILLWWTALCTWKYMPTKQSGVWKDSWISFWQNKYHCSRLSWTQCSKKWLGCCCASRGACPAWCTSSWEWGPPGAAVGGICHLLQWMVVREGEGSTGAPAPGRCCFAFTLTDGLGNAQQAKGTLWCARRDKSLSPDCSFFVSVIWRRCWTFLLLLKHCEKKGWREQGATSNFVRQGLFFSDVSASLDDSSNDSWRFLRALEAPLPGSVFWGAEEGLGKKGTAE